MPDEAVSLRDINWRETFPFTNIFRAFRVAIHPSKLVLALLALVCLYFGGRTLDWMLTARHRGVPDEIRLYESARTAAMAITPDGQLDITHEVAAGLRVTSEPEKDFAAVRAERRAEIENFYADLIGPGGLKIEPDAKAATAAAEDADDLGKVKAKLIEARDQKINDLKTQRSKAQIDEKTFQAQEWQAYVDMQMAWEHAEQIKGRGLWSLFMDYEIQQVNGVVIGVITNQWMGNLTGGGYGVFDSVYRFFCVGPRWAIGHHWVYFTILGIWFLIIWAIFGGAIARIAAVHVAREEKISLRQALNFSSGKFLSYVFAPVIPLFIILIVGLIVAAGGLLVNVPYLGEILVGVFFFLALAAGAVMTLVALGTAGGLNLMYPTVAVEGSDSFDAISRSFSYVYARPWRMLWYTVVAIAYGAITYLFVRLFVFLTLKFTQVFVGFWVLRHAEDGQHLWPAIYHGPSFWQLPYHIDYFALSGGSSIAAYLISLWVHVVIAFLGAYVVSFYFSANTIIYYLMRREVDATELDDVYVEQSEDEFMEPATATMTSTTTTVVIESPKPDMPPPAGDGSSPPAA